MRINEVSKMLNIAPSTIRYYEQRKLIRSQRQDNGYRYYTKETVDLLKLLLFAKQLGFTLSEINFFAEAMRGTGLDKQKVNKAVENKIIELNEKIKEFKQFQKNLKKALKGQCPMKVV